MAEATRSVAGPSPSEPLYQVKLLGALRSGDPALIHPFLADLNKERSGRKSIDSNGSQTIDLAASALHLAIRCASVETISLLLSHRSISPNAVHPPDSGTTPLHLAASLGRGEVVTLLLEQEEVDDTLRDAKGQSCKDVARNRETARIISDSRALLNASFLSLLRSYILSPPSSPPPPELVQILSSPRIRNVDLNHLDATSGTTLLHEAARRKDIKLVELAVRAGADVFVRDRKGKGVTETAGKDDRVKAFLRQFTNRDTSLLESPSQTNLNAAASNEPPSLKGYLSKYANVAKGYGNRWFVLKDGMLSYYRHQEDENIACRGSLSMKTSRLKLSSTDKLRFEIHSIVRNGEGTPQKWYIKANHPVEFTRWVQAIQRTVDWYKVDGGNGSDADSFISRNLTDDGGTVRTSTSGATRRFFSNTLTPERRRRDSPASSIRRASFRPGQDASENQDGDDYSDEESKAPSLDEDPPHHSNFELHLNATTAQIDLTADLLTSLTSAPSSSPKVDNMRGALKDAYGQLQTMFTEYTKMVQEREVWYTQRLAKEKERAGIWEDSLQVVVQEGEVLEEELKKTLREKKDKKKARRISLFEDGEGMATIKARPSRPIPQPPVPESPSRSEAVTSKAEPTGYAPQATKEITAVPPPPIIVPSYTVPGVQAAGAVEIDTDDGEDEDDEFFDAIEANALPNLVITAPLASPPVTAPPEALAIEDLQLYAGYEHPRERLAITADDRPPVSLWAVLKGSIGKDLTKISFPVFFNEPTSMLQRMAEDMEFSECLDAAAADPDRYRRIAFVAAFAMSNYSSTIGRIAKPFNPMLGETFEYVHLAKRYRYVSEQVSHHPPISACWADSPNWHYYGEVDAQNKFMGKSFEIRPTGVAHVDLKLPEKWEPTYPKAVGDGKDDEGKVIEHYSWKKVTTNVSGFIVGNPTIDHYGEMTVKNHRTGDKCILTFKPRGWRARDSFEIKGQVLDPGGRVIYEIAGRWNTQLVARAAGNHAEDLLPDINITSPGGSSSARHSLQPQYILLWRNTEKPKAPFNLTPYAITLNDLPQNLKSFLPPTDCRLRPDQRAFELGKYERANELKNEQEEFQRATRRKREAGEIPPHRPRWFEAVTEVDTGERYWAPIRVAAPGGDEQDQRVEYWIERERIGKANKDGKSTQWRNVDQIFVDVEI